MQIRFRLAQDFQEAVRANQPFEFEILCEREEGESFDGMKIAFSEVKNLRVEQQELPLDNVFKNDSDTTARLLVKARPEGTGRAAITMNILLDNKRFGSVHRQFECR